MINAPAVPFKNNSSADINLPVVQLTHKKQF
jgi:hypothetical protein